MRSTPTLNALSYPPVVRVTTMVVVVGATVSFSPLTVSVIVFPPTARPPRVTLKNAPLPFTPSMDVRCFFREVLLRAEDFRPKAA